MCLFMYFFSCWERDFTVEAVVLNLHFLKKGKKGIISFIFQMERRQSELDMLVCTSKPCTQFPLTLELLLLGFTYSFPFFNLNKYFESMNHLFWWFSLKLEAGRNSSSCWKRIWEKMLISCHDRECTCRRCRWPWDQTAEKRLHSKSPGNSN